MEDNLRREVLAAEVHEEIAQAERDAAVNIAANEAINRQIAQAQATDARIAANQSNAAAREAGTENRLLRSSLAAERDASASSAFGFYLVMGLLLAILLVGGTVYYFRQQNAVIAGQPGTSVSVNTAPSAGAAPTPTIVQTASPAPVIPPPIVHVTVRPPQVHNDVKVTTPPAPAPKETPSEKPETDTTSDKDDTTTDKGPGSSN